MNNFEAEVISNISSLENIFSGIYQQRQSDFVSMGSNRTITPDFILYTTNKKKKLSLLENMPYSIDGTDSEGSRLGQKWEQSAGPNYRYFMVLM